MEDIAVPDGATDDGSPASPDPEEAPAQEETAASAGDAQADDTQGDEDSEETTDGDEGKAEQGPGGAFDKLLAKYGGDKEKMAAAYFEQANSNSRLWEKLQGIEEYIKGQQRTEVDTSERVASDPDLKEIAQEYQDTQAEIQATSKKQDRLISTFGEMEKTIAELNGQMKQASDYEAKAEIRAALNEAKAEQKEVRAQIDRSQEKIKSLSADLKRLSRDYKEAKVRVELEVSRQRQEELARQEAAQQTRREFAEAMRTEAGRYGIPVESKQYAVLFQSINDRIYAYLSRLPEGSPGVDIEGAVQALMTEYADSLGLKARFSRASDAKRAAAAPPKGIPPAPKAVPKEVAPPKDGRWTKAFVEERARRMLGG